MNRIGKDISDIFLAAHERTTWEPATVPETGFYFDHPTLREVAPYIVKVHRGGEAVRFRYASAVGVTRHDRQDKHLNGRQGRRDDQLIVLVFDVHYQRLLAYAGYFIVDATALSTTDGRQAEHIQITPMKQLRTQLGLLLMVNCKLVAYDEYFTSLRFETDLADLSIIFMRNLILYMPNLFQKALSDDHCMELGVVGSADEDDEFDFPQCDIPFDYPEFDDESVIHFASDLKGRKRTVFSQHRVEIETSERWLENVLPSWQMAQLHADRLWSEQRCRETIFCPTLYYAAAAATPLDAGQGQDFFARVFIIGKCGDQLLVLPYANTDLREELQLLQPFATDVVYRRSLDSATDRPTAQAVDAAHLDVDEIHVADFVPQYDTLCILKYWKVCTSPEQRVVDRLAQKLLVAPAVFVDVALDLDTTLELDDVASDLSGKVIDRDPIDGVAEDALSETATLNEEGDEEMSQEVDERGDDDESDEGEQNQRTVDETSPSEVSDTGDQQVDDPSQEPLPKATVVTYLSSSNSEKSVDLSTKEIWKLISQFVPMDQARSVFQKHLIQWRSIYAGCTKYFAGCPPTNTEEGRCFLGEVLVLGCIGDAFIVLPVVVNRTTGAVSCTRPVATRWLYDRHNGSSPCRTGDAVDCSVPDGCDLSGDQLTLYRKYRRLVLWDDVCIHRAVTLRCRIE